MTKEQFIIRMGKFFLKKYFHNIPEIPISFSEDIDVLGVFVLEKSDNYNEDEDILLDKMEYAPNEVKVSEFLDTVIYNDMSWKDPENKPKCFIRLSTKHTADLRVLTETLLHELTHYYCWYVGYDYDDTDSQFIEQLKERGLRLDHEFEYNKDIKEYICTYNYDQIDKYIIEFFIEEFNNLE